MHGTCCPRCPALPVGWVWRGVPVGTPASRAPAHPPGGGLARARGSGCSSASIYSPRPFSAGALRPRYRGVHHLLLFARGMPGCALARGRLGCVTPPGRGHILWRTLRGHAGVCRLMAVPAIASARPRVPSQ